METKKIKYSSDIVNTKINNPTKIDTAIKQLNYSICDILGSAGMLKHEIFEDYETKKFELRAIAPGIRVKSFDDVKKKLDKGIKYLKEVSETLELRNMHNSGIYKAEDIHYGLYSVKKSLTRLSEAEIYAVAVDLTNRTTKANFVLTDRLDFVRFLDEVVQKASKSNHDAIEIIKKYHKEMVVDINSNSINVNENGNMIFNDFVQVETDERNS